LTNMKRLCQEIVSRPTGQASPTGIQADVEAVAAKISARPYV
jgi:hypothetical protein